MADSSPVPYAVDPTLFLYTSLTAGSSHIITATSRLETILKANKIPFRALDVATDEKARMLWGRRSKGKKLPGLVKFGQVVGDMEQIEEWNEYGELKQNIAATDDFSSSSTPTPAAPTSVPAAAPGKDSRSSSETRSQRHISISEPSDNRDAGPANNLKKDDSPLTMAMRKAGAEAAAKAGQAKSKKAAALPSTSPTSTDTPAPTATDTRLDKAHADPEAATEITAAKHPAQLASEGAQRTTVDKIADSESTSTTTITSPHSNEEQMLAARRSSSMTKQPSRLAQQTSVDDVDGIKEDEEATEESESSKPPASKKPTDKIDEEDQGEDERGETEKTRKAPEIAPATTDPSEPNTTAAPKPAKKIDEGDQKSKAKEGDVDSAPEPETSEAKTTAADEHEKPASSEKPEPQEQEAKDEQAAGVSVGD